MKKINIAYWVLTGLFSFLMFSSGVFNALVSPESVQGFGEMHLPAYLIPFLGWAKILGVVAILVPGYPRIKEWAYAGLIFDLIGAVYSIYSSGKTPENWAPIFLFIAIGFGSYALYHKRQAFKRAANVPEASTLAEA